MSSNAMDELTRVRMFINTQCCNREQGVLVRVADHGNTTDLYLYQAWSDHEMADFLEDKRLPLALNTPRAPLIAPGIRCRMILGETISGSSTFMIQPDDFQSLPRKQTVFIIAPRGSRFPNAVSIVPCEYVSPELIIQERHRGQIPLGDVLQTHEEKAFLVERQGVAECLDSIRHLHSKPLLEKRSFKAGNTELALLGWYSAEVQEVMQDSTQTLSGDVVAETSDQTETRKSKKRKRGPEESAEGAIGRSGAEKGDSAQAQAQEHDAEDDRAEGNRSLRFKKVKRASEESEQDGTKSSDEEDNSEQQERDDGVDRIESLEEELQELTSDLLRSPPATSLSDISISPSTASQSTTSSAADPGVTSSRPRRSQRSSQCRSSMDERMWLDDDWGTDPNDRAVHEGQPTGQKRWNRANGSAEFQIRYSGTTIWKLYYHLSPALRRACEDMTPENMEGPGREVFED